MDVISGLVHEALIFRGKRQAKRLIRQEGFKLIDKDATPLSNKVIEETFAKLTKDHHKQIQGFVFTAVGEVKVPAGGRIGDFLAAIKLWLSDPANREKLMNIVKFIMSIIAMLLML